MLQPAISGKGWRHGVCVSCPPYVAPTPSPDLLQAPQGVRVHGTDAASASHKPASAVQAATGEGGEITAKAGDTVLALSQVPLYEEAGFGVVGPSAVVHGQDAWLEMAVDFED